MRIGAPVTDQAVSRDLFGCNTEITRRAFRQGLSAPMAANRWFYVPDGCSPAVRRRIVRRPEIPYVKVASGGFPTPHCLKTTTV